jgi:aconitate decarboxylase
VNPSAYARPEPSRKSENKKDSVSKSDKATVGEATNPDGPTGRLATWLATLELEDVPQQVRDRAKNLILDGVACAIVGAKLPWSATAVEAVTHLEEGGDKTVIGWGRKASAPAASLLNGTFIQGFELDDFHPLAPLHSASVVLPSLLACAEKVGGVSGKEFLRGAIAGFEVGPRVGLALHGGEMLSRGWHSGSIFGTHASTAAAGTLLKLDAARFEDALGLAGTQSAGLMAAQYGAMCKRMHHGFSSRNGLYAAFLAAGGFAGIKQVFEKPYGGFLSTFGEGHSPDASQIADGLGERWETERIVIKPYAAMAGLHGPLDCLFEIGSKRALHAEDIEQIDVELSHAVFHHGWWIPERPLSPVGAQMNVAYLLAVAILDGSALLEQFSPQRIDRDDVWELIPKITAHHNAEFDAAGALGRGRTNLRVTFGDGSVLEASRLYADSIATPLSSREVGKKYRSLTNGIIDRDHQGEIERAILSMEDLEDMQGLLALLAEPAGSVF